MPPSVRFVSRLRVPEGRHSLIVGRLTTRLGPYVEANRLGAVLANGGFELFVLPRTFSMTVESGIP